PGGPQPPAPSSAPARSTTPAAARNRAPNPGRTAAGSGDSAGVAGTSAGTSGTPADGPPPSGPGADPTTPPAVSDTSTSRCGFLAASQPRSFGRGSGSGLPPPWSENRNPSGSAGSDSPR